MAEVDEAMSTVPKQGFIVPGTRDPLEELYEKAINFVESRIQLQHFVEEIS